MAQRAVSTKDALKHVNKRIGQARGSLRRQISLPVLFGAAGLVAFGCLIIWTASLTISAASFSRHLIGIGLGTILALFCWKTDFRGLSNITTVLMVIDIIVIFLP